MSLHDSNGKKYPEIFNIQKGLHEQTWFCPTPILCVCVRVYTCMSIYVCVCPHVHAYIDNLLPGLNLEQIVFFFSFILKYMYSDLGVSPEAW